jgi:hypothetical protein
MSFDEKLYSQSVTEAHDMSRDRAHSSPSLRPLVAAVALTVAVACKPKADSQIERYGGYSAGDLDTEVGMNGLNVFTTVKVKKPLAFPMMHLSFNVRQQGSTGVGVAIGQGKARMDCDFFNCTMYLAEGPNILSRGTMQLFEAAAWPFGMKWNVAMGEALPGTANVNFVPANFWGNPDMSDASVQLTCGARVMQDPRYPQMPKPYLQVNDDTCVLALTDTVDPSDLINLTNKINPQQQNDPRLAAGSLGPGAIDPSTGRPIDPRALPSAFPSPASWTLTDGGPVASDEDAPQPQPDALDAAPTDDAPSDAD